MQEICALDQEVKRLKDIKTMHKEFRRYVEMPSNMPFLLLSKPLYSWSYVKAMSLL